MNEPSGDRHALTRREFALGTTAAMGALAAGGVSAVGQAADRTANESGLAPFDVPSGTKQFAFHDIMNNDAVRIEMPVGVVNGSSDGPTLIVTGGLFATEFSGVEAASRMYRDFDPDDIAGRVIIIPVITLDAFRFRTPMFGLNAGTSPMDGKSLNSVFPGDPEGSATEVVAHYLFDELVVESDYHIDLRGGDLPESHVIHSIHPMNASERVNRISEEMSRVCGFEYFQARDVAPRSLIYEASQAGVPSIITQCGLGYKTQPEEDFINSHILAVTNNMKHLDMTEGSPVIHPNQREFTMGFDQVRATRCGVFQGIVDQGDLLARGQLIGRVTGLDGSVLEELHSPIDGVVHELLVRRVVFQGDLLYNLVQFKD
ncbi:MAG: succinylglutamate desuccinylase/aspartoacylase family protein [Gemmatimonadota bacterium]|nr:succinylglutamate desuccinylase/aspartoacylase family protein [Gemmatimonadota bacterium]